MDADRPVLRPAAPEQVRAGGRTRPPSARGSTAGPEGGPPEVFRSDARRASRRKPLFVADSVALVAVPLALLGWLGVACGAGLYVSARDSPEGGGFLVYFWLAAFGPAAVLSTAVAAFALYLRGSRRTATAFVALELVGLWALAVLRSLM